ncbi:MAG: BON domain-containing protein [Acidobacteria bacterium]|nr:BON domain-containing protein [Acidobacteriota bacterium]
MTYKSDEQIKQEVERELRWDTRVTDTEVGVTVHKGAVTLTGTIDSYAKKLAAQEAAHRVHGVLDVANDMEVKLPGTIRRNDTEVAQAVRRALEWDALVPDERIHSTVTDGFVTLTGNVDNMRERNDAERVVRYLLGVRGVHNQLIVVEKNIKPYEVREVIEDALERRADRAAKHIDVAVNEGAVTLTGTVRNWAEKRAVLGAVSHTPGIATVRDHLRVDPYNLAAAR